VPDVADLKEEKEDPVDGNNHHVHCESGVEMVILTPDVSAWQDIVMRLVKAVVNACYDNQQPGNGGEELVGPNCLRIIAISLDERVNLVESIHD